MGFKGIPTMSPGGSLKILAYGILIQVVFYVAGFGAQAAFQHDPMVNSIVGVLFKGLFFMPFLGILGIVVGVRCYKQNGGGLLPLVGIIFNALWLAGFAFFCHMVFGVGLTV